MNHNHWLRRPGTIRLLKIVLGVLLVFSLMPDFFIHQHAYFGIEDRFGFYAGYGFGAAVALVAVAKVLGIFIRRKDTSRLWPFFR
jgi:hypothetical protein